MNKSILKVINIFVSISFLNFIYLAYNQYIYYYYPINNYSYKLYIFMLIFIILFVLLFILALVVEDRK